MVRYARPYSVFALYKDALDWIDGEGKKMFPDLRLEVRKPRHDNATFSVVDADEDEALFDAAANCIPVQGVLDVHPPYIQTAKHPNRPGVDAVIDSIRKMARGEVEHDQEASAWDEWKGESDDSSV